MALVYSCCFWFSLRLGGILIGLFSIFQATGVLTCCGLAYKHLPMLEEQFSEWNDQYLLNEYSQKIMDNLMEDPHRYITWCIVSNSIYLITCIFYIYGAYVCSNILMAPYIVMELIRLISIIAVIATGLLLLKENTMDIGSLIGTSVVAGFFLLGMFYLWVCAANLPVLINEMERDEQAETIAKLQELIYTNQRPRRGFAHKRFGLAEDPYFATDVFTVPNRNIAIKPMHRSELPIPY